MVGLFARATAPGKVPGLQYEYECCCGTHHTFPWSQEYRKQDGQPQDTPIKKIDMLLTMGSPLDNATVFYGPGSWGLFPGVRHPLQLQLPCFSYQIIAAEAGKRLLSH